MQINKLTKSLFIFSAAATIAACSGSNGGGANNGANQDKVDTNEIKKAPRMFFDGLSEIPNDGNGKPFLIRLHNTFDHSMILNKVSVIDPTTNLEAGKLLNIDSSLCSSIPSQQSCTFKFKPHFTNKNAAIIKAEYKNSETGELVNTSQIVRMDRTKSKSNNGISFNNDLSDIKTPDGVVRMVLPLVLEKSY